MKRQLGLLAAAAVVVGEIVGVGIFLTPAEMASGLGSPFGVMVVWLVVSLTAFCGALCYGELAARFPEAGGGYVYLREAWGSGVAFLYGWKSLLVMDPGVTAALAVGGAGYAAYLLPLGPTGTRLFAVATILVLAAINALGARAGARVLTTLTVGKIVLLAVIIGWGFASGRGEMTNFTPFFEVRPGTGPLMAGVAGGLFAAFFSFGGFWDVAKLAGEVRDPSTTLPRALALGVGLAATIYVLTSATFIYLVPIEESADAQAFVARVGETLFGDAGGAILAGAVVIAVFACVAAILMASPRVYYAMARDGLFLRSVARVDPASGVPRRAIAIQAVLASILVLLGTFEDILGYFVFITVAFVALTVAGLFRLPRPDDRDYRVPLYPWTPIAFLALLAVILTFLVAGRPGPAAAGTAVVALGIPVYLLVVRRNANP